MGVVFGDDVDAMTTAWDSIVDPQVFDVFPAIPGTSGEVFSGCTACSVLTYAIPWVLCGGIGLVVGELFCFTHPLAVISCSLSHLLRPHNRR